MILQSYIKQVSEHSFVWTGGSEIFWSSPKLLMLISCGGVRIGRRTASGGKKEKQGVQAGLNSVFCNYGAVLHSCIRFMYPSCLHVCSFVFLWGWWARPPRSPNFGCTPRMPIRHEKNMLELIIRKRRFVCLCVWGGEETQQACRAWIFNFFVHRSWLKECASRGWDGGSVSELHEGDQKRISTGEGTSSSCIRTRNSAWEHLLPQGILTEHGGVVGQDPLA